MAVLMAPMSVPASAVLASATADSTWSTCPRGPWTPLGATLLGDELLGLVDQRFGLVADIGLFATLPVLVGVRFGVLDHPVDLFLGQAGAFLDLDRVLLAGALVLGGDVDDAVGVDVEGDLDLRDATRGPAGYRSASKLPSSLLCDAISRSPWKTWICTDGWLSSAVVKVSDPWWGWWCCVR